MDMSFVVAAPEMLTAAATDLANIGSTLIEEHTVRCGLDRLGGARGR